MTGPTLVIGHGTRVLCVAPHPDDETLGCGGTLAKWAAAGAEVHVLAVTVGNLPQVGASSDRQTRAQEFSAACRVLGVADCEIAWADDARHMRLDQCPQYELVKLIEDDARLSLQRVRPQVLLMPFAGGHNQDHVAVHRACFTVARPHVRAQKPVPEFVLGYRIPEEAWTASPEPAPVVVDTTETLETKQTAFRCYASQLRPDGHPRSLAQIRRTDEALGGQLGLGAAEAFVPYRVLL